MRKKFALALGSGGAKGIAHIGVLQCLKDNGMQPSIITGSSAGALIGACYAAGITPEEMLSITKEVRQRDLVDYDLFFFTRLGFVRGRKLELLFKELLGEKTQFSDLNLPFACTAVDLDSGSVVYLKQGPVWKAVLASCSIPATLQPVESEGRHLVDGGLLERVPALLARHMGARFVVGVDVSSKLEIKFSAENILEQASRTYRVLEWNLTQLKKQHADLVIEVPQPEVPGLQLKFVDKSYEYGYAAMLEALPKLQKKK